MTKNYEGHEFTEEDLLVNDLIVDPRVQRANLDLRKVEKMVADWNPDAEGRISVSRRSLGDLVVIDGRHRNEAKRRLTDNTGTIAARVFENLTLVDEAQLFVATNTTNQPKYMDRFKVRIIFDPQAAQIDEIISSHGWKLESYGDTGRLTAIATAEKIYRNSEARERDPNTLDLTLRAITGAWGHDYSGVAGPILEGVARLLEEHQDRLDFGVLVEKLTTYEGGPQALLREAQQFAKISKVRTAMGVASIVTNAYNINRRKNLLPAWRFRK